MTEYKREYMIKLRKNTNHIRWEIDICNKYLFIPHTQMVEKFCYKMTVEMYSSNRK